MKERWVLIAAVLVGASYLFSSQFELHFEIETTWKGASVALMAIYAASRARDLDGLLITAVMAFGAVGDVLLETHGMTVGAVAFLAGHLTAVWLYLRNRRAPLQTRDKLFAGAIWLVITALAFALPANRASAPGVALYGAGLGAMAAAAWLSRFPRALTALGAVLFAASDMLIFLRTGRSIVQSVWVGPAVWILYIAGQALIVLGVTSAPSRTVR